MHGGRRHRGLCLVFLVFLFASPPLTPFPVSSFQPSARLLSVDPVALPPAACLPHFGAQIRTGETSPLPQHLPSGGWGDCGFRSTRPSGERKAGCLSERGALRAADSAPGSPPRLPSGSEWPGEGAARPSPHGSKAVMPGQAGPAAAGAGPGLPRAGSALVGSPERPRGWTLPPGAPCCSPDPVDKVGGTFGAQSAHPRAPCLTRASFQPALPPAGPGPGPAPPRMGSALPLSLPGRRGASLGCYTSCTETVLAP